METYSYNALDKQSRAIRLLFFDLESTNELRCSLRTYNLSSCPPYIALSYAWGSPFSTSEIVVSGVPFVVRDNLWMALKTLKAHATPAQIDDPPTYFCVDAICNDQRNVEERNHQVGMMKDIYSKARCVIAWLGGARGDSEEIFEQVRRGPKDWPPTHLLGNIRGLNKSTIILSLFARQYWTRL